MLPQSFFHLFHLGCVTCLAWIPPILDRYDIARALLARRDVEVDVLDFRDRTPLVMAVQYGYSHLVRLMLIAGADPSTGESNNLKFMM